VIDPRLCILENKYLALMARDDALKKGMEQLESVYIKLQSTSASSAQALQSKIETLRRENLENYEKFRRNILDEADAKIYSMKAEQDAITSEAISEQQNRVIEIKNKSDSVIAQLKADLVMSEVQLAKSLERVRAGNTSMIILEQSQNKLRYENEDLKVILF
jgi:multidrug resistance efflux pump